MQRVSKMSDVSRFKVIREVSGADGSTDTIQLDAYLKAGWTLLDIHQRAYHNPQTNEEGMTTVYILGHSEHRSDNLFT